MPGKCAARELTQYKWTVNYILRKMARRFGARGGRRKSESSEGVKSSALSAAGSPLPRLRDWDDTHDTFSASFKVRMQLL
jgi:hypothetical protein